MAKNINYKDLLFDEVKLEANDVQIILKLNNKELSFGNNFTTKLKISLSAKSLKTLLSSKNWNWIGDMIINEILNQNKLKDIQIKSGQIVIKTSQDNNIIYQEEKIEIKAENGKLYLKNIANNKSIQIPIEEKLCITNANIKNNLINITANSYISF